MTYDPRTATTGEAEAYRQGRADERVATAKNSQLPNTPAALPGADAGPLPSLASWPFETRAGVPERARASGVAAEAPAAASGRPEPPGAGIIERLAAGQFIMKPIKGKRGFRILFVPRAGT